MILTYVETTEVLSITDNCISVPKNVILVTMEIKFNTSVCDLNNYDFLCWSKSNMVLVDVPNSNLSRRISKQSEAKHQEISWNLIEF